MFAARVLAGQVTLGVLLPSDAVEATSIRRGVELAAAQNCTPNQIRAIMRERGSQWGADGQEAAELVLDEGAHAIIAPSDGATAHLALQVAGRTRTPVISLATDSSVSGAGVPWSLRIAPGTREQAITLFTNANARRWCALVDDSRRGREAANDLKFSASAIARDLKIVSAGNLTNGVATMLAHAPDAVILWLTDNSRLRATVMRLRGLGYGGHIAVPCSAAAVAPDLLAAMPVRDHAAWTAFETSFKQHFGSPPDLTAALAYDAANLVRDIHGRSPTAALPDTMNPLNRNGASGILKFDQQGSRLTPLRATTLQP